MIDWCRPFPPPPTFRWAIHPWRARSPLLFPLSRRRSRGSGSPGRRRTTRRCSGSTIRSSPPSNAPSGLSGFRNTTPLYFHNALYFHVYPPLGRVMFSHVMLCHRRVCRVIACMVCYVNFCICHFFHVGFCLKWYADPLL